MKDEIQRFRLYVWMGSIFLILFAFILFQAYRLYHVFPNTYVWSELMLNYQGGMIKRALLGEIAYQLDGRIVPAPIFIVTVILLLWSALLVCLIFVLRLPFRFAGLLLLFSPGSILFPILDFDAFGRKDVVALFAVAASAALISRTRNGESCLAALFGVFLICGLFTEVVFFYFPLVFWSFLVFRRDWTAQSRITAAILAAAFVLGCLATNYHFGAVNDRAIAASWQARYPTAFLPGGGALCCLDWGLEEAVARVLERMGGSLPRNTYLVAFVLSLVPSFFLLPLKRGRPRSPLEASSLVLGCLSALAPLALASDWGRFISLFCTVVFLTVWTAQGYGSNVIDQTNLRSDTRRGGLPFRCRVIQATFLILFALSWTMWHSRTEGETSLAAGPLLSWVLRYVGNPVK